MKVTSVGILITDGHSFLACHSTGNAFYDLPKGLQEADEQPIDVCCRETLEETGIILEPGKLRDLGVYEYLRNKNLHLYMWITDDLPDVKDMVCTSYFEHYRSRKLLPEVDGYRYVLFHETDEWMTASMARIIGRIAGEYGFFR
ncbi:NUDIX hydrolase [Paenibacillus sepulcri]|uniref:NUDIX domain-containing protein n=1 Tax=Paenibacillus sepulcri TaxID=359917 RepID=A0ABS7CAI7_9BACL|nr:NUDIX domain-containing protein [Paenibacillus sepulcri]